MPSMENMVGSDVSQQHPISEMVALQAQLLYPFLLLLTFGVMFGIHSIAVSREQEASEKPLVTGPGGRPLPVTRVSVNKVEKVSSRNMERHQFSPVSRMCFQAGTAGIIATFLVNGAIILSRVLEDQVNEVPRGERWWCGEQRAVYLNGGSFFWAYLLFTLVDWKVDSPNLIHLVVWSVGLAFESFILTATMFMFNTLNRLIADDHHLSKHHPIPPLGHYETAELVMALVRTGLLAGMVLLYICLSTGVLERYARAKEEDVHSDDSDDETTPLLNSRGTGHQNGNAHQVVRRRNGDAHSNVNVASAASGPHRDEFAAFYRPEKLPHRSWWEYFRGYHIFFPYLWPSKKPDLQLLVLFCFVLVIIQRLVNIGVPWQLGKVVEALTAASDTKSFKMPWMQLFIFLALKLMQGPSAILGCARAILWIPVTQYSYISLQTAAFEHVHSLSLDFHLGKRTGELLSALNKGGSVNQFLEQTTFQVAPMLMDLVIAIGFFWFQFDALYALWATIITFSYLVLTIKMASTRADQRRDMVNADREEEAVKNDSITSYETVKYFNAEAFEFARYQKAIKAFQKAEAKVTFGMNMMNVCQSLVFMSGMLVVMMIAAYEVTNGKRTVGDFVMIMTYLSQLQGPLNFFGTFYRTVQQAMISGERLLELFKIQPTVVDRPGIPALKSCNGHIKWNAVEFWYDDHRPALRELTFECLPGTTTAFVGESGGGKSTIFRLMFRYYNCKSGSIEIDGNNVKDVTIDSVRRSIGVVPQDTILFNETIMYNLKYANPDVSEEEVFEACRSASIHDRILSFADGYNTKVGDRGLRLSGGEKQRVAIARTILKKPKIIMLDEATSALDSETEQEIQSKLLTGNHLGQDRTLLIIAHRLSTITHAEQIIVLHQGKIHEKGTHSELLEKKGRYCSMWEKQARAEQAARLAQIATQKAKVLLEDARIRGNQSGDDRSEGADSMSSSTILPSTPALELPNAFDTRQP